MKSKVNGRKILAWVITISLIANLVTAVAKRYETNAPQILDVQQQTVSLVQQEDLIDYNIVVTATTYDRINKVVVDTASNFYAAPYHTMVQTVKRLLIDSHGTKAVKNPMFGVFVIELNQQYSFVVRVQQVDNLNTI